MVIGFPVSFYELPGIAGRGSLTPGLGALVSFYAGLGCSTLGFRTQGTTIVAAMLLLAHDLPIEAAVSKKRQQNIFIDINAGIIGLSFGIGINYIF